MNHPMDQHITQAPLRVGLIGYGRMGREVERLAPGSGVEIVWKIDSKNAPSFDRENLTQAEVAIDFSLPETAADQILEMLEAGLQVVSGTTGWLHRLPEVTRRARELDRGFLHASNFSIGVNLFFALNRTAARLIGELEGWEPSITEVHHVHKKDKPSGTAISLSKSIETGSMHRWKGWHLEPEKGSDASISIEAFREADVPGTHTVHWISPDDHIKLEHVALGRQGFAQGALLAAQWIRGRSGIFTMSEVLGLAGA